jgi:hypothetical protein
MENFILSQAIGLLKCFCRQHVNANLVPHMERFPTSEKPCLLGNFVKDCLLEIPLTSFHSPSSPILPPPRILLANVKERINE